MDVCRPIREGNKERLGGMAKKGYCRALDRWFVGMREHLVFTPDGRLAFVLQMPGNRHDVHGLYSLLETSFRGCLLADHGYWPNGEKRAELEEHGIRVIACTRSNQKFRHKPNDAALLKKNRAHIERFIGLFAAQFNASRTQCKNFANYKVKRWCKAMAHNASRRINKQHSWPLNSMAHIRKVS